MQEQSQQIHIESQHSDLLNRAVSVMMDREFPLETIDTYISQIEKFLEIMSSRGAQNTSIRSYLKTIGSSYQAIHFFFKEVLAASQQGSNKGKKPEAPDTGFFQEGDLYRQIAL